MEQALRQHAMPPSPVPHRAGAAFPARIGDALAFGACAILLLPALSLLPAATMPWAGEDYIAIHSIMEMFAVAVSALVFGVGWNAPQSDTSTPMVVLASASLAIALLDFAHLLSWPGMPRFCTPASTEKTIDFWLAARFISAGSLILAVLAPTKRALSTAERWIALGAMLAYTAAAYAVILLAPDILPRMFIPGSGLTALKIGSEYGIAIVYGLTAVALVARSLGGWTFPAVPLLAACLTLAASELAFTLYSDLSDKYNFTGHVYKVVAHYFIYRCVFVHAVRAPFLARAEANERLRRQTEILSTLIGHLPVAVSLVDAELRFTAFNRLFFEFFDIPEDRLRTGDPFEKFLRINAERGEYGPGDIDDVGRRRIEAAIVQRPVRFERQRPNGRVIENRRVALPGGGFVTTYIDVTEARQREADLEQARAGLEQSAAELAMSAQKLRAANASKSFFLANMSHELRTPLNAILGFSEAMRRAILGPLSPRYQEYAGDIHASGTYLHRLIEDLLDTSRLEIGQLTLHDEDVDLTELMEECTRLVRDRAREGGIELGIRLPSDLPAIRADRLRLKQIILNLLSNAVKFTLPGGRVSLTAHRSSESVEGAGIEIVVDDTGIGMSTAEIPIALQPFQQLDRSRARRHEGTGLGLPLSKALAELHGGSLEIASELGSGTTVRVRLPARIAIGGRQPSPVAGS